MHYIEEYVNHKMYVHKTYLPIYHPQTALNTHLPLNS